MHVSGYIILFVLCGLVTGEQQRDAIVELKCKTGTGIDGVCSKRASCNYSTKNVDLTLYEPRGFKRICDLGDVCCPPQSIVKVEEPKTEKNDFTFDDDD